MVPVEHRFGALSLVLLALLLAFAGHGLRAQSPTTAPGAPTTVPGTVWDGVYTDVQAERGRAVFGQSCSTCHTLASSGRGPLVGEPFWTSFTQKTVGQLLTYVATSMPNGAPGSLPQSSYNDIVAAILESNGLPSGSDELAPGLVDDVHIVPKDGPGELPAGALVRVVGCLAPRSGSDWTVTNATAPERIDSSGPGPDDAVRPLGERTMPLKFALVRLDGFVGQRVSASGLLIGPGGKDGLNVMAVTPVAESCP